MKKINNIYIIMAGVILLAGIFSCQKEKEEAWVAHSSDAILMGYIESSECSGGFVFDIITDKNESTRSLKYSHFLPVDAHDDLYRYYPVKVRMVYELSQDSCLYINDMIKIYKIEIVR